MPWPLLYDEYPTAKANGPWYQFDPAQASELMQAAGYTADNPLEFEIVSFYSREPFAENVIPSVQAELPEIKIGFREVDNPTHVLMLSDRNFDDALGIVWGPAGFSMDQWIFPWWHSDGGLNYNNVNDAEMDRLLEAQRASTDLEEKKALWQQVWDRIHDQVWDIWWPEGLNRTLWHNWVLNYRPHGLMGPYLCYTSGQARSIWFDEGSPMSG